MQTLIAAGKLNIFMIPQRRAQHATAQDPLFVDGQLATASEHQFDFRIQGPRLSLANA